MAVQTASLDVYVSATVARWEVMRRPGQQVVGQPGLHGLLACADDPLIRLLVTDDRAYARLAALLPDARAGLVNVVAAATRCAELFDGYSAWRPGSVTAMTCRDLETVPAVPLPGELALGPVRRLDDDPPDGLPLESAVAAAMRADPRINPPPSAFADFLRSFPPAVRLFAAVDSAGVVRATSGSDAFGTQANVFFVNTDPDWRGRGIGRAMTAVALHDARESGAQQAWLDATDAGRSIYLHLGFEAVTRATHFFRPGEGAAGPTQVRHQAIATCRSPCR